MHFQAYRPSELDSAAVDAWSALQAADPRLDSPFLSPQWARAIDQLESSGLRGRSGARVAVARATDGEPLAFLPARVGAFTALPLGAPMCDVQGLVAADGAAVEARRMVQALGVQRFDFQTVTADQTALRPYLRGEAVSRAIDVRAGAKAFEAERRQANSLVKDLDKRRRKVEREVGPVTFTAHSTSRAAFDQLIRWKRDKLRETGQTDIFATDWTQRLLRQLHGDRDPDFGGVLFTLHVGDKLAAAHFHLRGRRTIHAWIIAHEPQFERYSPGLLLFQDIWRWMDGTPFHLLDFGHGDYEFKRKLANVERVTHHGFVGLIGPASLVRSAQYGVRDLAERLPLGRYSELPGKAMRRLDQWRGLRAVG